MTCLTSGTGLERRSRNRVARFNSTLPGDLIDALWMDPKALVDAGAVLNSRPIRRTVRIRWAGRTYVLKHYIEPSFAYALKHSFQPSRARRTWTATHALAEGGIATPRAVACIEERGGPLRRDSFMVYPYVEGCTLTSYFERQDSNPTRRYVWKQLQSIWERFAQLKVSLADTNVRNFILCTDGQLWVIDLDTTRFHSSAWVAAHYLRRSWERLERTSNIATSKAAPTAAAA